LPARSDKNHSRKIKTEKKENQPEYRFLMTVNNRKKSLKQITGLSKAHPYSRKAVQMKRVLQRSFTLNENSIKKANCKSVKSKLILQFRCTCI
jgi:hypothetical protein